MILLYSGCVYKHKLKDLYQKYKDILDDLKVPFIEIDNLKCCGIPLRNAGFKDDFRKVGKENVKLIHSKKISEIITLCPECNRLFEKHYKRDLGLRQDIKVTFITNFLLNQIKKSSKKNINITYQDSCFLGRRSGFYNEPRELISKLGYNIDEVENNKENSVCCGGGGNVREHDLELSESIAKKRVEEFKKTKGKFIVTNCPHCYICLSGKGIQIKDVSELF